MPRMSRLADLPRPSPQEVSAVAAELSTRPEQLTSVRLPGPGGLAESALAPSLPELDGFDGPAVQWLETGSENEPSRHRRRRSTSRLVARYESPAGSVLVVSHEHGPELFFAILGGAGSAATIAQAVAKILAFVRGRRPRGLVQRPSAPEGVIANSIRAVQREYYPDGTLAREWILETDGAVAGVGDARPDGILQHHPDLPQGIGSG
jgi:hypothetical protein